MLNARIIPGASFTHSLLDEKYKDDSPNTKITDVYSGILVKMGGDLTFEVFQTSKVFEERITFLKTIFLE